MTTSSNIESLISDLRESLRIIRSNLAHQENILEQIMLRMQNNEVQNGGQVPDEILIQHAWTPPERCDDISLPSRQMIRKIDPSSDAVGALNGAKKTWVGRFYVAHLKARPLFRRTAMWLWINFYPVYEKHVARRLKRKAKSTWYPLITFRDYAKKANSPITKVFSNAIINTATPCTFPNDDQVHLEKPHDQYEFPPICIIQVENARVCGGTNLTFTDEDVICHDLYNFEQDYTSEELHGRHVIDVNKKQICVTHEDTAPEDIQVAAAFVDACASNYAHWLTEVLPRVAAFCSVKQFKDVPVIVDEGLHKNIMSSLAAVVEPGREIITIPIGRAIRVARLYITSVAGYVPFEPRKKRGDAPVHGYFSPPALNYLKNVLAPAVVALGIQAYPKKIYIRRNSGVRKVTNNAEIERLLVAQGFSVVEPEKLSFAQQIALFYNADIVIGPTGAAMSNIIFSRNEAAIVILINQLPGTIYWYWQNIAQASGKSICYILGSGASDKNVGPHSDYYVDPKKIEAALEAKDNTASKQGYLA
ncbi:glycosyltransferase family 61 protein [Oryzisolibacter sp. LB2S]|uniref:glycosyltransferase family 61 protein n=1 Tax=Alicycliphilus soli TaxID=3228789 RepID=UPI0034576F61